MTPDPKKTSSKPDLPKCRVTGCLKKGIFENGICGGCKNRIKKGLSKKSKPIKKESSNRYSKALREAKASFQKLRRIQEADANGICICECGSYRHWTKCQSGHFHPAIKLATCFVPENVNPQTGWRNKDMDNPTTNNGYRQFMIKKYGAEKVQFLEMLSQQPVKFSTWELVEMKRNFDAQIEVELKKFKK